MPEPTLTQEQRAILRRLRQTTAHHTQLTAAADAQERGPTTIGQWRSSRTPKSLSRQIVKQAWEVHNDHSRVDPTIAYHSAYMNAGQ